jgi:hypothetical protein
MAVMVVLFFVGALIAPANAFGLDCSPPETDLQMTIEPYSAELTPGTTTKLLLSVSTGEGRYLYETGAQLPIFADIGSITPVGPHYFEARDSFGRGRITNVGEETLDVELCYVLVN